jgi:polar amino acid transport system substrate-binding protein
MEDDIMKKKIAMLLVAAMTMCTFIGGCGDKTSETSGTTVYAVEAGSAGEEAAQENGFEYNSVASQADALMEVASGTSDAAIIDLLMAGAMIGEGTSYPNMKYTDELTTEEYGVGCRQGSDLASYINQVFYESYSDGTMKEIATKYGVQEAVVEQKSSEYAPSDESDVSYIQGKGTLIVGITDFAPMDYKDGSDEWIGFDADMARLVGESLGVDVKFVEIDWDNKIMELNSKNIDVVWNGMTLTNEVKESMECTNPYCNNAQVIVVNK